MSAVLVGPDTYRKAVSAAALLSSDRGGEVVAALAAIERLLPDGTGVGDVFAAGLRPFDSGRPDNNHKAMASWALCNADLTPWEAKFCQSVFHYRSASPKQMQTLRDIIERELGGSE